MWGAAIISGDPDFITLPGIPVLGVTDPEESHIVVGKSHITVPLGGVRYPGLSPGR